MCFGCQLVFGARSFSHSELRKFRRGKICPRATASIKKKTCAATPLAQGCARPPLPALYNGLSELAHLSFWTRDILGWRMWMEGGERFKKKKEKKGHCWVSRRRYDLSTSPLARHSKQSQPRSRHNSLHSADARCRTMEEGPYKYMTVRRPDKEARKVPC